MNSAFLKRCYCNQKRKNNSRRIDTVCTGKKAHDIPLSEKRQHERNEAYHDNSDPDPSYAILPKDVLYEDNGSVNDASIR